MKNLKNNSLIFLSFVITIFIILFIALLLNKKNNIIYSGNWLQSGYDQAGTRYSNVNIPLHPKAKWIYNAKGWIVGSPAVKDSFVYVNVLGGELLKLDLNDGNLVWSMGEGGFSSVALEHDRVYAGMVGKYGLSSIDPNNGNVYFSNPLWRGIRSSPVIDSNMVFITSLDGNIYSYNSISGKKIWSRFLGEHEMATPAVSQGRVVVGSENKTLYCLSEKNGEILWKIKLSNIIRADPAIFDNKIYIGDFSGNFYCIDLQNGKILWTYKTGDAILNSAAVTPDGNIYFPSCDGYIYAVNPYGKLLWKFKTNSYPSSSVTATKDSILFGTYDGGIYALDITDGKLIWRLYAGGPIRSNVVPINNMIIAGSDDGKVYAFTDNGTLPADKKIVSYTQDKATFAKLENDKVIIPSEDLKCSAKVDVLIFGGSISALTVAKQIKDSGKSVMIIDSAPFLGGRFTQGFSPLQYSELTKTFGNFIKHVQNTYYKNVSDDKYVDTEILKFALDKFARENKIPVLFHSYPLNVFSKDGYKYTLFISKGGHQIIRSKVVIDASNNSLLLGTADPSILNFDRAVLNFSVINSNYKNTNTAFNNQKVLSFSLGKPIKNSSEYIDTEEYLRNMYANYILSNHTFIPGVSPISLVLKRPNNEFKEVNSDEFLLPDNPYTPERDIEKILTSLKDTEANNPENTFHVNQEEIRILKKYDVVIVGGGPSGFAASIMAARMGMKVALIEQYPFFGGMGTAGGVSYFEPGSVGVIFKEVRTKLYGSKNLPNVGRLFDTEIAKSIYQNMVHNEKNITVYFDSFALMPVMDSKKVLGVVIKRPYDCVAILGKRVIDATGDGDIAAKAGVQYVFGRTWDHKIMPLTTMFTMYPTGPKREKGVWVLSNGKVLVNETRVYANPLNIDKFSNAEMIGREQMWDIFSNIEKRYNYRILSSGPQIGVRESRHFLGEYTLQEKDILVGRHFYDGIALCFYGVDIHNPYGGPGGFQLPIIPYEIPLRTLIPQGVDNLIIVGRTISAQPLAMASFRVQSTMMSVGEAGGLLAAESIRSDLPVKDVDGAKIKHILRNMGVYLP
ncbi:Outer membrane protein assembly factor BamB [Thermodesulfobium acidiphilum]|uniref:Outer membrane protein assembly factor BamB n=1 Tax=Thermodesulfobium acidiphilum TaxID=1794699 RepID=A0A2R4W0A5_THEAF|nr:FAD-dependent oxidoreductase [Thermodesulfobium acidiphilum]AWB10233.1 Outer membrane protein assembly factor BamB [Thermodesulfobium acidiphilum]